MSFDFTDKKVLVMGLGRFGGGVGVARFLAQRGARVTVTDLEPEEKLGKSLARLADLPIRYRLGKHDESDFAAADLVVVNPAVNPYGNRFLAAAAAAGVPLTSEIRLLAAALPNRLRIIGITGSAGKSTTTAMIGHVLRKVLGPERVHVGGNLGGSLLENVDQIRGDRIRGRGRGDWVVLELSSFMLEGLDQDRFSPHIAVVTNMAPNHLDRHGTMDAYIAAKQALLRHQQPGDVAILGDSVADWPVQPRVLRQVIAQRNYGIPLLLPGLHNQVNAQMALSACTAALAATDAGLTPGATDDLGATDKRSLRSLSVSFGTAQDTDKAPGLALSVAPDRAATDAILTQALSDFPGLEHRLQFVVERDGVRYYNDSKATTPEATLLALRSFNPGVVHVILGGYDKGSDMRELAAFVRQHCRGVYTIGKTGESIATLAQAAPGPAHVIRCGTLAGALKEIAAKVQKGDAVLLSPACASWGQYENYEQRGAEFVTAVCGR